MQEPNSSATQPKRRHPDWSADASPDEIERVEQEGVDNLLRHAELFGFGKEEAEKRLQLLDECRGRNFAPVYAPAVASVTPAGPAPKTGRPSLRTRDGQTYDASVFLDLLPRAKRLRPRRQKVGRAPRARTNARRQRQDSTSSPTRAGPDDPEGEPEPPGSANASDRGAP
jgi:hypothetical protein